MCWGVLFCLSVRCPCYRSLDLSPPAPPYPLHPQSEALAAVPAPVPRPDDICMVLVYRDVNVSDPESGVARTLPALTMCGDPASKLLDPRIYELVAAGLALQ